MSGPTPRATFTASLLTVTANLVGAGLLSLPYTVKTTGIAPGIVLLVAMAVLNASTMVLIARCCDLAGTFSYKGIAAAAFGPRLSTLVSAVMFIYTLGSCVSFVVLIGDFLPALVCLNGSSAGGGSAEDPCAGASSTQAFWGNREMVLVMAGALVLYPLALPRHLDALRYTSSLSAACILYTAAVIAGKALSAHSTGDASPCPAATPRGDLVWGLAGNGLGVFRAIPILAVAYTVHYNSPKFYAEMRTRTLGRLTGVTAAAFALVLVLYLVTALGGYSLFGGCTASDVLQNFPQDDGLAISARVALTVIVLACYPLAFNSFRASATDLLPAAWGARVRTPKPAAPAGPVPALEEDDRSPLVSGGGGKKAGPSRGGAAGCCGRRWRAFVASARADWPHAALTKTLVILSVIIGIAFSNIGVVLSYKGALAGTQIVYMLPAAMHFALVQRRKRGEGKARDGKASPPLPPAEVALDGPLLRASAGGSSSVVDTVTVLGEPSSSGAVPPSPPSSSPALGPLVWSPRDLVTTPHGVILTAALIFGFSVMVLGTLVAAKVINVS